MLKTESSACQSTAESSAPPRDQLYEWYTSPDQDWDECCYVVTGVAGDMQICQPAEEVDSHATFTLESVSWPCELHLTDALDAQMDNHRVLTQLLEVEENKSSLDHLGDIRDTQKNGVTKLCRLELRARQAQQSLNHARLDLGVERVRCLSKGEILEGLSSHHLEWRQRALRILNHTESQGDDAPRLKLKLMRNTFKPRPFRKRWFGCSCLVGCSPFRPSTRP